MPNYNIFYQKNKANHQIYDWLRMRKSRLGILQAQGDQGQTAANDQEAQEEEPPHARAGADVLETNLIFLMCFALVHNRLQVRKTAAFRFPPLRTC